jgi:hypothetical protein
VFGLDGFEDRGFFLLVSILDPKLNFVDKGFLVELKSFLYFGKLNRVIAVDLVESFHFELEVGLDVAYLS